MTRSIAILFLTVMVVFGAQHLAAQTTEFTYQGNLVFNGQPATGNYDFEFSLHDTLDGQTQIGSTLSRPNVPVADGVFSVGLDFGNNFDALPRYLKIRVRVAGTAGYTELAPRARITRTPTAIHSLKAIQADTALSAQSAVNATSLGGVAASQYVLTTDPRLSDARNPLPNNANYVQNRTTQQTSSNFNISGNGTAGGTITASVLNFTSQLNFDNGRLLKTDGSNHFLGILSGQSYVSGFANSYFGQAAGRDNIAGESNSMFGSGAGANNTASFNSFFGASAGNSNEGASDNSFFGYSAGRDNLSGTGNSYFGKNAGLRGETGSRNSMFGNVAGLLSTGSDNSFFGEAAGRDNNSGSGNTFIGRLTGFWNRTGSNNTLIGNEAWVESGALNFATAIGARAVVSTSNTVMLGRVQDTVIAPNRVIVGDQTTARGELSIYANSGNADLYLQGPSTTTGINIAASNDPTPTFFISHYNGTTYTDRLIITPTGTVRIPTLGSAGGTSLCRNASLDIATCSSSARYKTNIADFRSGIDVIRRLRPVTFNWTAGNALDLGLVAEEVAGIDPLLVTYNDKGEVEGVKYDRIGVVLINTVKEQQEKIEKLEAELRELRQLIIAVSKSEKKEENK